MKLAVGVLGLLILHALGSETIFNANKNVNYELNKPLAVGDVIRAWGVYKDHTTAKFSVNIRGANNVYLLHVDFRPYNNVVVLNSKVTGWQTEIRPAFGKDNLVADKAFEVRIEVHENEYRIFYNGAELSKRFPQRQALSQAEHVTLHGGSNGFQWTALHLPGGVAGPGIPFATATATKNFLERPLVPGDVVTAWGIYATASSKFNVNLMMENDQYFMIHVDFRPPPSENKVVLNSKKQNGWEAEIRTPIPTFVNGQAFKVEVKCYNNEFEIFVDGVVLGSRFPYRDGFALEDVKFVWLLGGSNGMVWTDLALPVDNVLGSRLEAASVFQNNVGAGGEPERAVDGNTNGNYGSNSCTHSAGSSNNWWQMDFSGNQAVSKVIIYNRADCCQDRIDKAKVYVGDEYCGEVAYQVGQAMYEIECNGAVGGSVRVVQDRNILTLCEVQVYGSPSDEEPLRNVALGHPTWQNSVSSNGDPNRAVDGFRSGNYGDNSCTHTSTTDFSIWNVDIIDKYEIEKVIIYNRQDCCGERLNTATVFVHGFECGKVEYQAGQDVYVIDCGGRVGSVVKVANEGNVLTLCEVEVLARSSDREGSLINVAGSGVASQDSTGWDGVAARAIDGAVSGEYFGEESCSHNADLVDGWWNLAFSEPQAVKKVVIYNREDCCQDRIDGVKVYADDIYCGRVNYVEGQSVYKVGCNSDTQEYVAANNIRIEAAEGTYLTLCEVKVFADPQALSEGNNLVNLAYLKPTSQSSTAAGGVPERAVDGKEASKYSSGTCTHTSGAGWWKVDLEDNFLVEKVWIKNRADCCSERLDGAQVYVGDILCGVVEYNKFKYNYEIECGDDGLVGNYVKIVNEQTSLTLCEVKVFGDDTPIQISTDIEVTGEKSSTADDAISEAKCPAGYAVIYCESSTGQVHERNDGAYVKSSDGSVCVSVNGYQGPGAIAKAVCSPQDQSENPCNGPSLPRYKNLHSRGPNPSLSCPPGYTQVLCNARSPWRGKLTNKGVNSVGVIPNDSPCAVSGCTDSNWCEVTAVCQRIGDLEEYAAAACATCDGYTCGDGQECVMTKYDDDDSDDVPSCRENQTGCDDNDKCGRGECLPVGGDGYTCECVDGEQFSAVTSSCIPVHSAWEIVYGEGAIGDDAISYAECPTDTVVMRCHTFGAPTAADGVYITTDEEGNTKCIARASYKSTYPVMAIAYCGARSTLPDVCTGDNISTVEYRYESGHSPCVGCPAGYIMEACMFHSPWSQQMTASAKAMVSSIASVPVDDDNTCSIGNCLTTTEERKYCKLSAVCSKLAGTEYIREACPTCDRMRCPDDRECLMVNDLPVCEIKVPGGCEVNDCGRGQCIEDGADFSCECDAGFLFNEETCVDDDECTEMPCGNGQCVNSEGSYTCECDEGYTEEQGKCVDIDECKEGPCSSTERCSNTPGSYICDCLDTFIRNADQGCVCADGFTNNSGECADVNECDAADACGDNEDCTNTIGGHLCECKEGFERGEDGSCQDFAPIECDIRPKKERISTFIGNNVQVKLVGEGKKTFKKFATITWTRNNEIWDPKSDGKEKFNGFTLRNFQAEDVGVYVGNIYIEKNNEYSKCSVTVHIGLNEGSVTIGIKNREALAETQKAGKGVAIQCDVDLTNVVLEDPSNPNNVNWYKVNQDSGDDVPIEETDLIKINKNKGTYRLWFVDPQAADSCTYKCEFDQEGVSASTDVSVIFG